MIFETTRLIVREMMEEDFDDLCDMLCDAQVMYAYEHAFTKEEAQDWLQRQFNRYRDDGVGLWAMIRKSDHVMIGQCGITKQYIHQKAVWEIGYILKKQYWGQGYASEASRGCKQYAFDVLHLDYIYSIIRDNNVASQRVAMASGMRKVTSFVKHYYHMNMPHDVYEVENVKLVKHMYIDGEFDSIKINGKFHQTVISLGAVCSDGNGNIIDTFYDTIRPKFYQRTSRVVLKMTGLDEEVIRHSRSLQEVISDFRSWLHTLDKEQKHSLFYSFGPDDKRTLQQHCELEQVEVGDLFSSIKDLQKPLSASVMYQGAMLSPTLSLDNLKLLYNVQGEVEHNALSDAIDLMKVHMAYRKATPCNVQQMQTIIKQKEEKALASKQKQQKRLQNVLKKRFAFVKGTVLISFLPDVLDQFRAWETHDPYFNLRFKKDRIIYDERCFSYDELQLRLQVITDVDIPYVTLHFIYQQDIELEKRYLLTYRNAGAIERIIRRLECFYES